MKICTKCQVEKPDESFYYQTKRGVRKRRALCISCTSMHHKSDYEKNKERYKKAAIESQKRRKREAYKYVAEFLLSHPCIDCGESDIDVLEFDHIDRDSKVAEICTMIKRHNRSLSIIIEEMNKCEVRCANCHRKKTRKEQKSSRLQWLENTITIVSES